MNNRRLDERVYGDIPESFDTFLLHTLHEEPRPKRMPKPRLVPAMVLAVLLLAGTALAVTQGHRIMQLFGIGSVNEEAAQGVIATSIPQQGGTTDIADFTVSEVYYDGTFLRFVIDSRPKQSAVLRDAAFAMLQEAEDTAGLPGKRYGVTAGATSPQVALPFVGMGHANGDLYLYVNTFLSETPTPDTMDITVHIDLLDIDDGSLIESTALTFTAGRTATPVTTEYELLFETDYVRLDTARIAKTPLETIVSVTYHPLLRAFGGFTVVPADGYIVRDNSMYRFGNIGTLPDPADGGRTTMTYMLPVEHGAQSTLLLWITSTDQAIEIDLDTGAVTARTVAVAATENNVQIMKVEE